MQDDVAGRLDVDGAFDHRHQFAAQLHEAGRDVGIVLAERAGVYAGKKEAGRLEERQALGADEGEIEIARAGAVGVERSLVFPASAGDGASAEHDDRARRDDVFNGAAVCVQLFRAPAKGEPHDVLALLLLG